MPIQSQRTALKHLAKVDPVLGKIIKNLKLESRPERHEHFRSLVTSILNQQISTYAAASIIRKFCGLYPGKNFPSPEDILHTPTPKLRRAGLSRAKAVYIKDLSRRVAKGEIDFAKLKTSSDEEVITELIKVKGIGRWTAEMFLIFSLNRPDIFSKGDLGLQNAVKRIYKMRRHPTPAMLERLTKKWAPHRSLASLYLWASLDNKK